MAKNKVRIEFGVKTGFGRTTAKHSYNQLVINALVGALLNETGPQVQKGYDKMTENWNQHPQFKFSAGPVHQGTLFSWELILPGETDENGLGVGWKWAMVDTLGRTKQPTITPGRKVINPGYQYIPVAGRTTGEKLRKGRASGESGEQVYYDKKRLVSKELGGKKRMPIRPYNPSTFRPSNYGGSKTYDEPVAYRQSVKLGKIEPRNLTVEHVITALRGKSSSLSSIIEPIMGRKAKSKSAIRRAHRAAVKAIGRGILASGASSSSAQSEFDRMKELYEREAFK